MCLFLWIPERLHCKKLLLCSSTCIVSFSQNSSQEPLDGKLFAVDECFVYTRDSVATGSVFFLYWQVTIKTSCWLTFYWKCLLVFICCGNLEFYAQFFWHVQQLKENMPPRPKCEVTCNSGANELDMVKICDSEASRSSDCSLGTLW